MDVFDFKKVAAIKFIFSCHSQTVQTFQHRGAHFLKEKT